MNNVITQATYLVDKIIKSASHTLMVSTKYPHLIVLRDNLNKLLEQDLLNDDFARLFCRRLKRLMNYNTNDIGRQCEFWTDIHEDLLYVLYGPNVRQDERNWERFFARMQLEGKLEHRESQFVIIVGERRSLFKLLWIHRKVLDEYLHKCVSFHSKVQVRDLIDKVDDLLCCTYEQTEVLLTTESRVRLQEKLKCIEISFDCSNVSFQQSTSIFSAYEKSYKKNDDKIGSFLPSVQRMPTKSFVTKCGITALLDSRWVVILGDPGCSKTTLLRWITCVYAEAVLRGDDKSLFRIPILIRISEFTEWLKKDPDLTLIDYIGKHTWFTKPYNNDDIGNVLKEFIYHGHALILLDGLNEIPILAERCKIVDLVKNFIDDYVRAPNFLSPFEDASPFDIQTLSSWHRIDFEIEMSSPKKCIGNQIIITSRTVGYDLYPLDSPCIEHFTLNQMEWKNLVEFVNQWVKQVEESVRVILLDEGINLGEIRQEILINRLDNIMNVISISDQNLMNPHMISLFCMHIFTSSDECAPKSPIEVYSYGIQSVLRNWTSLESNISERILIEFFTDLAVYIHLLSPSNLIDEFDMKKLCYVVLKRLNVSNNRKVVEEYINRVLSLLNSNNSIVAKQEFEVFSFIHVSFQRYFVVQALIRESSIESIVIRFFKFMNKRRFHESLLMALGWISCKWSFNNYNHFCDLLISYPTECFLPFGTLLFFDALKYIHNLPSKEVIFKAFNNLVDHPSKLLSKKYLKSSQLPIELIVEWMELNITNEKRLVNFCRCLLHIERRFYVQSEETSLKTASPRLFQQLWSLRRISHMAELVIDQTLHEIMRFYDAPDHIFENNLYSYLLSQNIHPLIFSVILALCGGLHFTRKETIVKVEFSPKIMHRESSMIEPIIDYLVNIEQSHSIKVQILIEKYENILQKSSPKDISPEIIDAFIALICLRGVSNPSIYDKFDGYEALPLVLLRFKQILLQLNDLYRSCHSIHTTPSFRSGQCFLVSEIESIINEFFCQPNQSDEQLIQFSFACMTAWKKLGLCCLSNFVNNDVIQKSTISQYLEFQFEYRHYITSQERRHNILSMTEYTPFDLLVFVPQSLQQLFYRLIISPIDKGESLPLIVLLSECLMRFDNTRYYKTNYYRALSLLYPLCKKHKLENYSSILFWDDQYNGADKDDRKRFFEQVKNRELLDRFPTDVSKNWEVLINQERERIHLAMSDPNEKDLHLFGACLSLARLFQVRYRSFKGQYLQGNISIFTTESEEIYSAIQNISDTTLQLIVLNIILRLNKPLIFTDEQINRLNQKIIVLLNNLLPNLSLLSATYLFIQYYERLQSFPNFLQQFSKIIGKKFDEQNQQSAYIALRILNDINLSYYLSKFEKQNINLPSILHFNSTTFSHYFSKNSSDTTLLSSMYLITLSTDVQILEMYTKKNSIKTILPLEELDQLWKDPSKYKQILTIEVADWITEYLKVSNREYIDGIIERVSSCCVVEGTAYNIISTWREYRKDKDLKFFAYYSALFVIEDNSIEILNELFDTHNYLHLKTVIKSRLELESVTSSFVSNILIPIIHGAYRISMNTSACINCIEILDLLLTTERDRILSNEYKSSEVSNRSFLSMVRSCSQNLQHYLVQRLQNQYENIIKEQYLIAIIKWIILESIDANNRENISIEIYECIIKFLHDQRIPLVQTMIAHGINAVLISDRANKGHVFIRDDLKKHLEDIIIDKTNINREDFLAACLLAYGNCLLKFNYLEMNQNVSIEIQNLLEQISLQSSSEILSARALLCLLFSKNENVKFVYSSNWIKNNLNLPVQKRYDVLLELTLYKNYNSNHLIKNEIKNHIEAYSSILLVKFLTDWYWYSKYIKDIFATYESDYVDIGWTLINSKSDMFFDALQKTFAGEKEFKTALCQASKRSDNILYLGLYACFGELTNEFVEILINVGEKHESSPEIFDVYFRKIKNVSGRNVIENLFELFQLKFRSKSIFSIRILELLVYLAQQNHISELDVYHQVNNGLDQYDKTIFTNDNDPFFCLLKLRKFEGTKDIGKEFTFLTMENIEVNFKKNIQRTDKNSGLLFEEIPFSHDI